MVVRLSYPKCCPVCESSRVKVGEQVAYPLLAEPGDALRRCLALHADMANPPTNAGMLAFGNLNASAGDVVVQGWLYDVKNSQSPQESVMYVIQRRMSGT